jgi:hypothetical protein
MNQSNRKAMDVDALLRRDQSVTGALTIVGRVTYGVFILIVICGALVAASLLLKSGLTLGQRALAATEVVVFSALAWHLLARLSKTFSRRA